MVKFSLVKIPRMASDPKNSKTNKIIIFSRTVWYIWLKLDMEYKPGTLAFSDMKIKKKNLLRNKVTVTENLHQP